MKRQLTEAEAQPREAELKAAGIKVVTDAPATITLLTRPTATEAKTEATK